MIDYAKDLDKLTATSKPPTPDERLREAVLAYMKATRNVAILGDPEHREAFHRSHKALVDAFNCANSAANMKRDPRPCINAAVEVERKPWWRFW